MHVIIRIYVDFIIMQIKTKMIGIINWYTLLDNLKVRYRTFHKCFDATMLSNHSYIKTTTSKCSH